MPSFLPSPHSFLSHIFHTLETLKIDVSRLELDHLCYRVETWERYEVLKKMLETEAELLKETMINGRPICTYKLKEAIRYEAREIWVLELPAPKDGSPYQEGFEHVEFVIDTSFEDFMQRYPHITFDTKAMGKAINPDIGIEHDGARVKFHHNSLEYVVKYLEKD